MYLYIMNVNVMNSSINTQNFVSFLLPYTLNKGFIVCLADLLYFLVHTIIASFKM